MAVITRKAIGSDGNVYQVQELTSVIRAGDEVLPGLSSWQLTTGEKLNKDGNKLSTTDGRLMLTLD